MQLVPCAGPQHDVGHSRRGIRRVLEVILVSAHAEVVPAQSASVAHAQAADAVPARAPSVVVLPQASSAFYASVFAASSFPSFRCVKGGGYTKS